MEAEDIPGAAEGIPVVDNQEDKGAAGKTTDLLQPTTSSF
jgi:hypothetical protein